MAEPTFPDHFSGHAATYARHRPQYPDALYAALADLVEPRHRAWDCATGNGQAAVHLADHFDAVVATDASEDQLAHATPHPAVTYRQALAEDSGLADDSCDLVTVAAALHWFDHDRFYPEVQRVLRPGGLVAAWSYSAGVEVSPAIDRLIDDLVRGPLAPFWPPQFALVQRGYRDLPFPFEELPFPSLSAVDHYTAEDMLAHVRTWSGVQRCMRSTGDDPTAPLEVPLREAWGPDPRRVCWPLFARVGRAPAA